MNIIKHPDEYKEGVRILMLTLRSKEGGKTNNSDRITRKLVSRSREEFDKKFQQLQEIAKPLERIYATADPRDMEKAIRIFKQRQLDADYFDIESRYSFYKDISNRWISSLQSPSARVGTTFLIDIDEEDDEKNIREEIEKNKIILKYEYKTKNGKHFILEPFNPKIVSFKCLKNYMILWAY